jgi:hypothetical protein
MDATRNFIIRQKRGFHLITYSQMKWSTKTGRYKIPAQIPMVLDNFV